MTDKELMQQALEALEKHAMQRTYAGGVYIANVAIALRERLAQPEQEPVAWMDASQTTLSWENYLDGMKPLYTTPPAAQRQPHYNKTEMNCFVQNLYDQKMREGKRGHYETMFHVVHRAIETAHGITGEKK